MAPSPSMTTQRSIPRRSLRAITRALDPAIGRCELTHLARAPIDYPRAVSQHEAYVTLLESLGLIVMRLEADPALPDAVFVEDTAVVLDELAVITHPGAASRRLEVTSVAEALRTWRPIVQITAPGTLDGGDVLQVGRTLYVGLSSRSNAEGAEQLRALVAPFAYRVQTLPVSSCLHLKSAVTLASDSLLLINPAWCDPGAFDAVTFVEIDPDEPYAANVLRVDDSVIMAAAFPRTAERLRARGVQVHTTDLSELAKAEGAATCCSLIFSV
jgi:dimethylargininase